MSQELVQGSPEWIAARVGSVDAGRANTADTRCNPFGAAAK